MLADDINSQKFTNSVITNNFKVIPRNSLKPITNMNVEGKKTYLGELRNFKTNDYINTFLPNDLSIGWVKLPTGETLAPHFHPCASMIIVTKGTGRSLGDSEVSFKEGDIIHIPAWNLHGFQATGVAGFEGLSIQFQETAIFESESNPETTYIDRESIPLKERELVVFERESLTTINSVTKDNKNTNLGIVKNFRSNSLLSNLLPKYFSCAWVHLNDNETLNMHQHNEKSLILVTNGTGHAFDESGLKNIKTGDSIYVPSNALHGFKGTDIGFWGLSIQFNQQSLYEDVTNPRVHFLTPFEKLKAANELKFQKLNDLDIFKIPKEKFEQNPKLKLTLLDCLQVISDNFQRLMFSRVALAGSKAYKDVFMEHLLEELNHDTELKEERGQDREKIWDPILESSTSWFLYQNQIVDDPKRTLMVSMVLEKCASKFYGHFAAILKDHLHSQHIENHCEADPHHENLGLDLIEKQCAYRLDEFIEFINKSWDMMILYIKRKGELVIEQQSLHLEL